MGQRPLYKLEDEAGLSRPGSQTDRNAGLYFDKFCDTWSKDDKADGKKDWEMDGKSKLSWIRKFTGRRGVGVKEQLEESVWRLMRMIKMRGGRAEIFKSEYGFVTGLGRSHPVENGFAWHPTLGTPYLTGSSIKGLVRAWAKAELGSGGEATLNRLLGSRESAGHICCLDAIPVGPVALKADVMTPHYADWSPDNPPGDWLSPKPIPFLTMAEGTPLLFGIIPCGTVEDGDLEQVVGWLREALTHAGAGAGAKTAVGYGRFGVDEGATSKWNDKWGQEQREAEAQNSPEGRWRLELHEKSEADVLRLVQKNLKGNDALGDPGERRDFAKVVLSECKEWVDQWSRGKIHDSQSNIGKKKLKEYANLVKSEANI